MCTIRREESTASSSVLGPLCFTPLAGGSSWASEEDWLLLNCSKSYLILSCLGPVPWGMACLPWLCSLWVTLINPFLLPEGTSPLKWGEKRKERSLGVRKSLGKAQGFRKQTGMFMFSLSRRQHNFHVLTSLYHQVRDWRRSEETCLLNRFQSLSHRMWLSERDHKPNQRPRCALTHSYSKPDMNLEVKAPVTFYLCRCWETQMSCQERSLSWVIAETSVAPTCRGW